MSDRSLLEDAAKAAGIDIDRSETNGGGAGNTGFDCMGNVVLDWHNGTKWNPLTDDGDALRLAVKLRMVVSLANCCCCAVVDWDGNDDGNEVMVRFGASFSDKECNTAQEATRLAITRAAAAISSQNRGVV